MTEFANKRKHKRLPLRTHVFVSGDGFQRFKTETMDFSDGGLFVEGKVLSQLKINTLITVQVTDTPDTMPELSARIAWTNRYGAGIQYLLDDE